MEKLARDPSELIDPRLPDEAKRGPGFAYREFVIVGHSLGAVIARYGLLFATRRGETWPSASRLLLFAPAHTGARVQGLAALAVQGLPFLRHVEGAVRGLFMYWSPLIRELEEGSRELGELQTETAQEIDAGRTHLIPRGIVIAEYERIVSNVPFSRHDPTPIAVARATHSTVCKPTRTFSPPIDALVDML